MACYKYLQPGRARPIRLIGLASGLGARDPGCAEGPLWLKRQGLGSGPQRGRTPAIAWDAMLAPPACRPAQPQAREFAALLGGLARRGQGVLSRGGFPVVLGGFGPFPEGFQIIPFADARALEAAITPDTAAFLIEPVQGEGGIIVPPEGYLAECARICHTHHRQPDDSGYPRPGAIHRPGVRRQADQRPIRLRTPDGPRHPEQGNPRDGAAPGSAPGNHPGPDRLGGGAAPGSAPGVGHRERGGVSRRSPRNPAVAQTHEGTPPTGELHRN